MVKCPFCQFENEEGVLFCEQCKTDIGIVEPVAVPAAADALGAVQPPLVAATSPPVAALVVEPSDDTAYIPEAEIAGEPIAMAAVLESTEIISPETVVATPPVKAAPATLGDAVTTQEAAPGQQAIGADAGTIDERGGKLAEGAKPKLVVLRGQRINAEYPIYDGDNYIGRADDKPVNVDLEDQEQPDRIWSSRQHALITYEDGKLTIEDLNSLNGTFVNRAKLQPGQKRPLQVNDLIQIGTVQMKVKL